MKKFEIRNGMHVITNNGEEYVILSNIYAPTQIDSNRTAHIVMAHIDGDGWMNFDEYTTDLRCNNNSDYDIQAVFVPKFYGSTLKSVNSNYADYDFTKLWERPIPKKMTKAEIEKELGYEIEIIED